MTIKSNRIPLTLFSSWRLEHEIHIHINQLYEIPNFIPRKSCHAVRN
jgi:hypothetical protein